MRCRVIAFASLALVSCAAFAQDNSELAEMFRADQAARQEPDIDWVEVGAQDAERRDRVTAILEAGGIQTALDYYNAAMVFQHGGSAEEIRLAHAFATISSALGNSSAANWLKAASWDRLMLRFEQPQWYGTQYVMDDSGRWVLYEVQPDAVTDEQRTEWSVPSLEEAQARAEAMNSDR